MRGVRLSIGALFIGSLWASNGCSFLIDFPDSSKGGNGSSSNGSTSNASGVGNVGGSHGSDVGGSTSAGLGGGGGLAVMACYGSQSGPTVEAEVWRGISNAQAVDDRVITTGLVHVQSRQELYAYGNTLSQNGGPAGLQEFSLPSALIFGAGIHDDGTKELVFNGRSCDSPSGSATTRFMTPYAVSPGNDHSFFFEGSVAMAPSHTTSNYAFGPGSTNNCGTIYAQGYNAQDYAPTGYAPFSGVNNSGTSIYGTPQGVVSGVLIEAQWDGANLAALGIGAGEFDAIVDAVPKPRYFLNIGDGSDAGVTEALTDLPINTSESNISWAGTLALDDTHVAWFGGSSCAADGGCNNPQAVFGHWAVGDPTPTVLVKNPGATSAVTSIRNFAGLLLVGGRYQGSLIFLDATLPQSAAMIPFVIAVDPVTQTTVWTYPAANDTPMSDTTEWRSTVDLAGLGVAQCGAVYLTGCISPTNETVVDCATPAPGKRGFVSKLDLTTGREIWTQDATLGVPATNLFVPSALTADDNHVWLAATLFGSIQAWGMPLTSGTSNESVVLRITN